MSPHLKKKKKKKKKKNAPDIPKGEIHRIIILCRLRGTEKEGKSSFLLGIADCSPAAFRRQSALLASSNENKAARRSIAHLI
jgi:hypothetical protein